MQIDDINKESVFGVVGVCGINGNIIARILDENGFKVYATDTQSKDDCKYKSALNDYPNITIIYGKLPDDFFDKIDYVILPTALINSKSTLYQKARDNNVEIVGVDDILNLFEPAHPVICITGTNGKTTTTTLLKHIATTNDIKVSEHNLEGMQGNAGDIPALQSRLKADINILETGTTGIRGSLTKLAAPCKPDVGIITNITPDHLNESNDFLSYAKVKGELISLLENKTLVINNDDPTIKSLIDTQGYDGRLITFGLDVESTRKSTKQCFCGKTLKIDEHVSGCGKYECECGLKYSKADYMAYNINDKHDTFTLKTPDNEEYEFKLSINGIHNIYNAVATIIVSHEILDISYENIKKALLSFTGVSGRMEMIGKVNNTDIMIDYAHNPAGITTVLKELKNSYDKLINVITTSSESGIEGDKQILDCALEYADIVIPSSYNTYVCAKKLLDENRYVDKLVLPDKIIGYKKEGTLGASVEQVLEGFKKSLEIDADLVVCTGEAAFKYKNELIKFI